MQLNTKKIKTELNRLGKDQKWLAEKLSVTPPMISYIMREKPITQAERIGKVLGIEPRDLIK